MSCKSDIELYMLYIVDMELRSSDKFFGISIRYCGNPMLWTETVVTSLSWDFHVYNNIL